MPWPLERAKTLAQPKVGVQALLRWTDPTRGAVSPLTMVAIAEQTGHIAEIGAWILERACRNSLRPSLPELG
jgi:EAL domain-containing protein (putative c-di-GMP-specific phosphodiesterase class I)